MKTLLLIIVACTACLGGGGGQDASVTPPSDAEVAPDHWQDVMPACHARCDTTALSAACPPGVAAQASVSCHQGCDVMPRQAVPDVCTYSYQAWSYCLAEAHWACDGAGVPTPGDACLSERRILDTCVREHPGRDRFRDPAVPPELVECDLEGDACK